MQNHARNRLLMPAAGALFVCLLWAAMPSAVFGQTLLGGQATRAAEQSLVGTWFSRVGAVSIQLTLSRDGVFTLDGEHGAYEVQGDSLKLRPGGREVSYQFTLEKDVLTLSGGDLAQPIKLFRRTTIVAFLRQVFRISPESLETRFYRVFVILGVVGFCRLTLALMRVISRFIIFSDWGPLRFVYRYRKNRALTLHALGLNIAKYVIYFAAFGFMLGQIGISPTAYLASLSVVGLAVGFGSQGFVQDMVTGFFVIFEAQFDVGDMVEISGQVGIVEELGLRMTKLRNFLGQTVFIPNRNIAVVGTFVAGAQHAHVDVACASEEAARQEAELLKVLGDEMREQFQGAIRRKPEVTGPLSLRTGEHFIRMHVAIWPQQQWVIQDQLMPRARDLLKQKGFEMPGDRISVSYHGRQEQSVQSWERALRNLSNRIGRGRRRRPADGPGD